MTNKGPKQEIPKLIEEASLQGLFYDQLQIINESISRPLPVEAIHYSSLVFSKFKDSKAYFEEIEGKYKEKVLGIQLLEATNLSKSEQKSKLMDVGETSMLLCGMFKDSLNKKLNDPKYYSELGMMAYKRLNHIVPRAYELHSFYGIIASYFTVITTMISAIAKSNFDVEKSTYIYKLDNFDEKYFLQSEVLKAKTKKIS